MQERERFGGQVLERVRRDVQSGVASGEVQATRTLFIDGTVYRGSYDSGALIRALSS